MTYPTVTCECGAEFFWAVSEKTGSRMPINAQPVTDGNIYITNNYQNRPLAHVITNPAAGFGKKLYTSHFTNCPAAKKYRRR